MHKKATLNLLAIVAAVTMLLPALAWAAYPAEVPRTGQTTCYDDAGTVIDCAGTGQDGDIQAGVAWPDPRFIDNGDGTVNDKLTGIVWSKDADLPNGPMSWQKALDYVAGMNAGTYPNLGYTDWRLPNINELESLIDLAVYCPALLQNHPFTNVRSYYYWSSTSLAYNTDRFSSDFARVVYIVGGQVNGWDKSTTGIYVWPVRAKQCGASRDSDICLPKTGQTLCYNDSGTEIVCDGTGQDGELQKGVVWPVPRFIDNDDGTVTDRLTGLEWTKDANIAATGKTWQEALEYVKTLTTGDHNDWRLPNVREQRSLVDYSQYSPALPQNHPFMNVQSSYYWSSTSIELLTELKLKAWIIGLQNGGTTSDDKTSLNYIWPVRTGDSSPCPATQVLGTDNPKLENLRNFRDRKLAQSALGRKAIQIYYNNAGSINAVLERSPVLRAAARRVLEMLAPMSVGQD